MLPGAIFRRGHWLWQPWATSRRALAAYGAITAPRSELFRAPRASAASWEASPFLEGLHTALEVCRN